MIKAKTELLSSKTNFQRVTGERLSHEDLLEDKLNIILPSSLKASLEIANLKNLELLIAKLEYEIAVKDLSIEKSRLSPSASINISKSENSDFSSSIDEKDDETVKATITWPIIKGGENISSIKKSTYEKQRAQLILQDTKNKILTETSTAWSKYQSFKSVLEATKSQLKRLKLQMRVLL